MKELDKTSVQIILRALKQANDKKVFNDEEATSVLHAVNTLFDN